MLILNDLKDLKNKFKKVNNTNYDLLSIRLVL